MLRLALTGEMQCCAHVLNAVLAAHKYWRLARWDMPSGRGPEKALFDTSLQEEVRSNGDKNHTRKDGT